MHGQMLKLKPISILLNYMSVPVAENAHLLRKGKDHCTADRFGFSCFAYVELDTDLEVWSNPNKSNRLAVVLYFPSCCIYSMVKIRQTASQPPCCEI